MEFEIKKDGNTKYLYLKKIKFEEDSYHIQMLLNNQIKGLLPITIRNVNNEREILYNITGLSSLNNVFGRNLLKKEELTRFALAIKQLEETLREYLLCGNNVKFDLNNIYYRLKQKEYYFCYCPSEVDDFSLQMKSLFNQVLDYIDYNDREVVSLAYGMQEIASRDDFAIEELLDFALDKKEEVEPIIIEQNMDSIETDEEEIDDQDDTILNKIKNIFKKEKKEDSKEEEYDISESLYIEETDTFEDYNFETGNLSDEEATVLLTSGANDYIVLKSINQNPEIIIIPDQYPYVIGKSKRNSNYKINSNVVSRVHARINCELGEFTIEDLNSTNGTFVNDERLRPHEAKSIDKGDVVKLADLEFSVE